MIKASVYKKIMSILFILNTSLSFANNNVTNHDNLVNNNSHRFVNNFNELSLIYENKGNGNYFVKSYSKEKDTHNFDKYKIFIEDFFSDNNQIKDLIFLFRIIGLNFYIDDSYNNASYSTIEEKEIRSCYINVLINEKQKNLILLDDQKNFNLMLAHELAHCLLGKNVFNEKDFWKYEISNKKKSILNKIIINNTRLNVKIINGKSFYVGPIPIVVYHEIFADVFSSLLLYNKDLLTLDDIEQLKNKRIIDFNNLGTNPKSSYISFKALEDLLLILRSKTALNLELDEVKELSELLAQKYFIEYLLESI